MKKEIKYDENLRVEDYLNQHPSMIEDLRIVAKMVEKKAGSLAYSLRKYADELAPYSPFDYPAEMGFKNPFKKKEDNQ